MMRFRLLPSKEKFMNFSGGKNSRKKAALFYLHRSIASKRKTKQWVGGKSFVRKVAAPTKMPPIIMLYCSHTLGYPTSALLINNAIQDPIGGIKFCPMREAQKKTTFG